MAEIAKQALLSKRNTFAVQWIDGTCKAGDMFEGWDVVETYDHWMMVPVGKKLRVIYNP